MVYLVDSAGARITDQVDLFPGRRGAGQDLLEPGPRVRLDPAGLRAVRAVAPPAAPTSRRSATSSRWSTATPACTSAPTAWSRWSPARRPRSRRWAARGCTARESGVGHFLCKTEDEALETVRRYLSYLPSNWQEDAAGRRRRRAPSGCRPRGAGAGQRAAGLRHAQVRARPASTRARSSRSRRCWAREVTVGFGRLDGQVVGVVAQQLDVQGRRAVRRLGRQGDPVRAALRRVQRPAAVPLRRARLHGRQRRWRSRASSGTAPR